MKHDQSSFSEPDVGMGVNRRHPNKPYACLLRPSAAELATALIDFALVPIVLQKSVRSISGAMFLLVQVDF
jgi:hypothetical protein